MTETTAGRNWPKQAVLVPVDFSTESLDALQVARELVASVEGLHVVHVLEELSPIEVGELLRSVTLESRRRQAERVLLKRLEERNLTGAATHFLPGSPPEVIADLAQQLGAELIVIPSHGRTGLRRLMIGSVAERVVRSAHCPVLVLRR